LAFNQLIFFYLRMARRISASGGSPLKVLISLSLA